jgi:hypothetical protein
MTYLGEGSLRHLPRICVVNPIYPNLPKKDLEVDGFCVSTGPAEVRGCLLCVDLQEDRLAPGCSSYPRERRVYATCEPPSGVTCLGYGNDPQGLLRSYARTYSPVPGIVELTINRRMRIQDTWARERGPEGKRFLVTAMISQKSGPPGDLRRFRHDMLLAENDLRVPTLFYNHTGCWQGRQIPGYVACPTPPGVPANHYQQDCYGGKDCCFDAMFHVAIESTELPGYATEKLLDCFATCTVPLYIGDPDLRSDFLEEGVIRLDRDRWVEQINALTEDDYRRRLPAVLENQRRVRRYRTWQSSIMHALRSDPLFAVLLRDAGK